MARNSVAKVSYIGDSVLQWTFADKAQIQVDLAELPDPIKLRALKHGVKQKGSDSYAGAEGDIESAKKSLLTVIEGLKKGDWSVRGEAGPRTNMLSQALFSVWTSEGRQVTEDQCKEAIAKLSSADEEDDGDRIARLRKNPKVAEQLARLRFEAAQKRSQAAAAKPTAEVDSLDSLLA